jgi:malonyl-CoA O-methyltransferase
MRLRDVRRRADRAAAGFDNVDFVHETARDSLLARLLPITIDARTVLDLGTATGSGCPLLARRFRRARILALDVSAAMLRAARQKQGIFHRYRLVQADACNLPLADHSIDVVFANLLLPWIDVPQRLFEEVARVLREGGVFAFSTLGPDSLSLLRRAWQQVDDTEHVNRFIDMHDLGDAAMRAGLRDPVLDVDRMTVTYQDADRLFGELTAMGARNSLAGRARSLTGKARFQRMLSGLEAGREGGSLPLELEFVFGHCFGAERRRAADEVHIDANRIRLRGR